VPDIGALWEDVGVAPKNLVNIEAVSKSFGKRPLLEKVSLGVSAGERIAVVGRNGAGKSTLLKVFTGAESVDSGRVTVGSDVHVEMVSQVDSPDADATVASVVVPGRPIHEWAGDARVRDVLTGLLGGFNDELLNARVASMSGGERRRVQLAKALINDCDLLLLDEPTNHLDVDVISWLVDHLQSRPKLAIVVVTHDRWFLDAVCDRTWEVVLGKVEEYDGGYSSYVLAKAERDRQASSSEARRQNLLRKELAWLRRGAPARTSKPKFRIDAANELIQNEPPPRDSTELLAFAGARLGKSVFELQDASMDIAGRRLLDRVNLNFGPGDRIGLLGANGAGKTSLIRMLLGEHPCAEGKLVTGVTVKPAYLSQHLEELDPNWRVLEAVEKVASRVELGKGRELSASQLCERLGFNADGQWTPVGDLSGGERRRLQLTRLLMGGPNVLVLDEPTNDFDVETLTALEDLLDSFAGTLIVISHDRYFLERVCDDNYALFGDGTVTHLTGGIDEFIERRRSMRGHTVASSRTSTTATSSTKTQAPGLSAGERRIIEKDLARIERTLSKLEEEEATIHGKMAEAASDHERLAEMNRRLQEIGQKRDSLDAEWLVVAESLT
jgi:ATP-binding cassette subfamily F protein uup